MKVAGRNIGGGSNLSPGGAVGGEPAIVELANDDLAVDEVDLAVADGESGDVTDVYD